MHELFGIRAGQFVEQLPDRQKIRLMRAQIATVEHDHVEHGETKTARVGRIGGVARPRDIGAGATAALRGFADVEFGPQQALLRPARLQVGRQFSQARQAHARPARRRVEREYVRAAARLVVHEHAFAVVLGGFEHTAVRAVARGQIGRLDRDEAVRDFRFVVLGDLQQDAIRHRTARAERVVPALLGQSV